MVFELTKPMGLPWIKREEKLENESGSPNFPSQHGFTAPKKTRLTYRQKPYFIPHCIYSMYIVNLLRYYCTVYAVIIFTGTGTKKKKYFQICNIVFLYSTR